MNRIQILPDSVKKRIAAGEVVEGPFSVVKELMENSIDAGATEIDVEIFESGLKKIAVKDNGSGMLRDDLPLSIMEHATSKIRDDADIEHISSFGFRGEALSSVSSISRVTIFSRAANEETGGKLTCREGTIEMSDFAGATGTTVIVENLYYNTPARKKFLKSHGTELKNIKNTFLKTALSHPGIAFSLSGDNRRLFTLDSVGDVDARIEQVYGEGILNSLYSDSLKDIKVDIRGFLSKPDFLKSTRSMQMIYVNGRHVEYRYLGFLLTRAYEAVAPRGRYPAAIIFLNIDPRLIDVNIHPAKREIKFFDQKYIDSLIDGLCRKILGSRAHAIGSGSLRAVVNEGPDMPAVRAADEEGRLFNETAGGAVSTGGKFPGGIGTPEYPGTPHHSLVGEKQAVYHETASTGEFRMIGVALGTYILFETGESLHFIDFHAAHERFIYDELMRRDMKFESQQLIFPFSMELQPGDCHLLSGHTAVLSEIGFDIDVFSENTVVVRGVPELAGNIQLEEFIADFIEALRGGEPDPDDLKRIIAREVACHSARRSGDGISVTEAEMIINRTMSGAHDLRCPHGRPYLYKLDRKDLERMFKRS